jgi:hypothetical protein
MLTFREIALRIELKLEGFNCRSCRISTPCSPAWISGPGAGSIQVTRRIRLGRSLASTRAWASPLDPPLPSLTGALGFGIGRRVPLVQADFGLPWTVSPRMIVTPNFATSFIVAKLNNAKRRWIFEEQKTYFDNYRRQSLPRS